MSILEIVLPTQYSTIHVQGTNIKEEKSAYTLDLHLVSCPKVCCEESRKNHRNFCSSFPVLRKIYLKFCTCSHSI